MAILAIGMILPAVNKKKKIISLSVWAMVVAAILVVTWPLLEISVFGADVIKRYIICCMEQIRAAQFTTYLPRFELLMMSFYVFVIFVQSSAMLHFAKYSIKQITGTNKELSILIPLSVFGFLLTHFMIRDNNSYIDFLNWPWPQICAGLGIGLPVVLFVAALIRGKLKGERTDEPT